VGSTAYVERGGHALKKIRKFLVLLLALSAIPVVAGATSRALVLHTMDNLPRVEPMTDQQLATITGESFFFFKLDYAPIWWSMYPWPETSHPQVDVTVPCIARDCDGHARVDAVVGTQGGIHIEQITQGGHTSNVAIAHQSNGQQTATVRQINGAAP
jgi:hypothetical protein